jgi:hypothetical protein
MKVSVSNLSLNQSKLCLFTKQEPKQIAKTTTKMRTIFGRPPERSQGQVSRESCTQHLQAFFQDTMGPLLVQMLHASVANVGGDIASTA